MLYKRLDGTIFEGPMFHPNMEIVGLEDGKTYLTVFDDEGQPVYRRELTVDNEGHFIYDT